MKHLLQEKYMIPLSGILVGLIALALTELGNPANMGFCSACFLHDMTNVLMDGFIWPGTSMRPEIPGVVLGAFAVSLIFRDGSARGGSSPLTRFMLGFAVMVGALVFLGCPLRMLLRIAGGDLNAVAGLAGFLPGVATGALFLNRGFTLERSHPQRKIEGYIAPALFLCLLLFLFQAPPPLLILGRMHYAPVWAALAAGVIIGAVGQRTRLCFISGVRDAMLFRHYRGLWAFAALLGTVLIGNLLTGRFTLGFEGQPAAHTEWLWNILGLYLVGFGSALLGGCPLRQLVLAGSGNSDAAITVLGLMAGAALANNFGIASSAAGTTSNGKTAFAVCLLITFGIAVMNTKRGERG
jgi:hypothetical protein